MDTRHVHIDEISVWSCVAASVFAMIALAAMFLATHDNMKLASGLSAPALPFRRAGPHAAGAHNERARLALDSMQPSFTSPLNSGLPEFST